MTKTNQKLKKGNPDEGENEVGENENQHTDIDRPKVDAFDLIDQCLHPQE